MAVGEPGPPCRNEPPEEKGGGEKEEVEVEDRLGAVGACWLGEKGGLEKVGGAA